MSALIFANHGVNVSHPVVRHGGCRASVTILREESTYGPISVVGIEDMARATSATSTIADFVAAAALVLGHSPFLQLPQTLLVTILVVLLRVPILLMLVVLMETTTLLVVLLLVWCRRCSDTK